MAHMLIVPARELGNPIVVLVQMKSGDRLDHAFCGNRILIELESRSRNRYASKHHRMLAAYHYM